MRDINGYELNGAGVIAALLYGQGDFIKTAEIAFSFGWDCDNNAATACTILGTMKGYKWIMSQGWQIVDRYKNTTRDGMPMDETITSFADRLIQLSEKVIVDNGGEKIVVEGQSYYRIPQESPATVYALKTDEDKKEKLRMEYGQEIKENILNADDKQNKAKAAYMAVCLEMVDELKNADKEKWEDAVSTLNEHWKVMQNMYLAAQFTSMIELQNKFEKAGIIIPTTRVDHRRLWAIEELCYEPEIFTQDSLPQIFQYTQ